MFTPRPRAVNIHDDDPVWRVARRAVQKNCTAGSGELGASGEALGAPQKRSAQWREAVSAETRHAIASSGFGRLLPRP